MAIVQYKCDVCERIIELANNPHGLEIIDRCIITDGCRGSLYQTAYKQDLQRGQHPPRVEGLLDWSHRRVIYDHVQSIKKTEWLIKHNLESFPVISVTVARPKAIDISSGLNLEVVDLTKLVEYVEYDLSKLDVETIDQNNLKLIFPIEESGKAQLITYTSQTPDQIKEVNQQKVVEIEQDTKLLTNTHTLAIGTLEKSLSNQYDYGIGLEFELEDDRFTMFYIVDSSPNIKSPWSDFDVVYLKNKSYVSRSLDFTEPSINLSDVDKLVNGQIVKFFKWDMVNEVSYQEFDLNNPISSGDPHNIPQGLYDMKLVVDGGEEETVAFSIGTSTTTWADLINVMNPIVDDKGATVSITTQGNLRISSKTSTSKSSIVILNGLLNDFVAAIPNSNGVSVPVKHLTPIENDEVVILLSENGFTSQDKIYDKIISLSSAGSDIFNNNRELYSKTTAITDVFPTIIQV
jgi:hypothetical protein